MKKWIPLIALFLTAAMGLFGYLRSFTLTDKDNIWMGVTSEDAAGWEITGLADGVELPLTPQEAIDSKGTVLLRRTVMDWWLDYETIEVDGHRPVCIWVDDELVFSNFPACLEAAGEFPEMELPEGQPFNMVFSMNSSWLGNTMTVASSLFGSEPFGSISFALLSRDAQQAQNSIWVAGKTFPGAAFGVVSLLLFGLFLFRVTMGKGALPLLYLTAAALVQMLHFLDGVEGNPLFLPYFSLIRVICILFPLLYLSTKMNRMRRLFLCLAIPLWGIYFGSVLVWEAFYLPVPDWFSKLAYLTLALLPLLLWCGVHECRQGSAYFGRFLVLSGTAAAGYGVLFVLGWLLDKKFLQWLQIYWWEALAGYPMPMAYSIFSVILVILFLLAIWDLVDSSIQSSREIEALKLRSELTAKSLASIQEANETLARVRHDELHHLRTLAALNEEDGARAAEYAASLAKELERIPSMRFTENKLVNAILSVQSGSSAAAGVQFEAKAKLPDVLSIPDTELSTVLMNLLENAVEAASKSPANGGRRVSSLLEMENGTLLITITNSLPEDFNQETFRSRIVSTTKKDTGRHGYGIPSARSVVSRRGGELRYSVREGIMTLNTAMELDDLHAAETLW